MRGQRACHEAQAEAACYPEAFCMHITAIPSFAPRSLINYGSKRDFSEFFAGLCAFSAFCFSFGVVYRC
jgi:hypothetical protein